MQAPRVRTVGRITTILAGTQRSGRPRDGRGEIPRWQGTSAAGKSGERPRGTRREVLGGGARAPRCAPSGGSGRANPADFRSSSRWRQRPHPRRPVIGWQATATSTPRPPSEGSRSQRPAPRRLVGEPLVTATGTPRPPSEGSRSQRPAPRGPVGRGAATVACYPKTGRRGAGHRRHRGEWRSSGVVHDPKARRRTVRAPGARADPGAPARLPRAAPPEASISPRRHTADTCHAGATPVSPPG